MPFDVLIDIAYNVCTDMQACTNTAKLRAGIMLDDLNSKNPKFTKGISIRLTF